MPRQVPLSESVLSRPPTYDFMKPFPKQFFFQLLACGIACAAVTVAAQESAPRRPDGSASDPRPPEGVPGPGGRGGPMMQEIKLVEKFDKDGDEKLDREERKAAREYL